MEGQTSSRNFSRVGLYKREDANHQSGSGVKLQIILTNWRWRICRPKA